VRRPMKVVAVIALYLMAGCTHTQQAMTGAAAGGVTGAVIGGPLGRRRGRRCRRGGCANHDKLTRERVFRSWRGSA
jgi:hypothetical protein